MSNLILPIFKKGDKVKCYCGAPWSEAISKETIYTVVMQVSCEIKDVDLVIAPDPNHGYWYHSYDFYRIDYTPEEIYNNKYDDKEF